MEIALFLLLFLLAENKTDGLKELPPVEPFKNGDWKALVRSDWFARQSFGGVSGKEIAGTAAALENLAGYGDALKGLFGKDSVLSPATAGELLKNLGGLNFSAESGGESPFGNAANAAAPAENAHTPAENPFAPIANIADAEILCALTRYFAA